LIASERALTSQGSEIHIWSHILETEKLKGVPGNVLFVGLGVWFLLLANQRVTLYEDAIEVTGWLSTRKLMRDEILGYRIRVNPKGGFQYIIAPMDRRKRALRLPIFLHTNKFFSHGGGGFLTSKSDVPSLRQT